MTADTEELCGEVAAVVFANHATGFGVVEVATPDEGHDLPRAAGPLAGLVVGQPVRLVGQWTDSERYGPTFKALYYEQAKPTTIAALEAFLASSRFPGVGKARARRLTKAFGLDLERVIDQESHRLAEVKGITPEIADAIVTAWREAGALARLVSVLAELGLPPAVAQAVHRMFRDAALDVVADDPYRLLGVRGVRWQHADALGRRAGIDPRDDRRLRAAAVTGHAETCMAGGHSWLPDHMLATAVSRLLGAGREATVRAVALGAEAGDLVDDAEPGQEPRWYAPVDLAAEKGVADELARLVGAPSRVQSISAGYRPGRSLTGEQQEAVRRALEHPVSVLTGGPGTGKTRTVQELVAAAAAADLNVALCAPTGRAAKRLEELTGARASTIHRLLEARPAGAEDGDEGQLGFLFGFDDDRRLPYDLLVVDEWSMADLQLAWAFVRAIDDGAHVVFVGDPDQLPSVAPGAVLRDLLAASTVPSTRLTTVHRQAATSRIVTLAHEINAGSVAPPRGRDGDVFAVPEQTARIADRVAEIVAVRAPDFFGCRPSDVQVLAPMYRGEAGIDRLNERLKERLNPAAGRRAVAGFHEGDRVVQTRNDAELDVANGDIGEVTATDPTARSIQVAFPHGLVTYDLASAADLRPAWCLSVHKAQGGEWPVVVLVCDAAHRSMLWRELVYTGVTRAAVGLIVVGDPSLVASAARRRGSGLAARRTLLAERIDLALATAIGPAGAAGPVSAGAGGHG